MSRRNRRRADRSNVRTLPTVKTHRYWVGQRAGPRYGDNRDLFRDVYSPEFLARNPPLVGWDYVDLGVFTEEQVNQFRREGGKPLLDPRDRKYGPRVVRGINVNVPRPGSPARYGPNRFFTPGTLAAATVVARAGSKTICEVRQERKEVMFATNKAGKVGQKSPVWTRLSRKVCK